MAITKHKKKVNKKKKQIKSSGRNYDYEEGHAIGYAIGEEETLGKVGSNVENLTKFVKESGKSVKNSLQQVDKEIYGKVKSLYDVANEYTTKYNKLDKDVYDYFKLSTTREKNDAVLMGLGNPMFDFGAIWFPDEKQAKEFYKKQPGLEKKNIDGYDFKNQNVTKTIKNMKNNDFEIHKQKQKGQDNPIGQDNPYVIKYVPTIDNIKNNPLRQKYINELQNKSIEQQNKVSETLTKIKKISTDNNLSTSKVMQPSNFALKKNDITNIMVKSVNLNENENNNDLEIPEFNSLFNNENSATNIVLTNLYNDLFDLFTTAPMQEHNMSSFEQSLINNEPHSCQPHNPGILQLK